MLAERIKRRGLVIVLSDLLDDKEQVLAALRHFRHRKHEVLVFQILDPNERDFVFKGPLVLRDLETSRELTLDPRVVRRDYQRSVADYFRDFERRCGECMIDYHAITSDMPFDKALFSYLEKRSRLG
jgi:Tfp pilus assembly ATPase PilU